MVKQWLLLGSIAFGVGFGVSLPLNRDLKQSAFAGLAAIPATSAAVLLVERKQKQLLTQNLGVLQAEIRTLEAHKQNLTALLRTDTETSKDLQKQISDLRAEIPQLQATIALHQEQQALEQEKLTKLERQQQECENAISALMPEVERLETRIYQEQQELELAVSEKEQRELELVQLRSQLLEQQQHGAELDAEIVQQRNRQQIKSEQLANLERQQCEKENDIAILITELQELEIRLRSGQQDLQAITSERQEQGAELARLRSQISIQQQRQSELNATVAQQQSRQQKLSVKVEQLRVEQQQLQAQIDAQIMQRESLLQELAQLESQHSFQEDISPSTIEISPTLPAQVFGNAEDDASNEADELTLANLMGSPRLSQSSTMQLNFANSDTTQKFWENRLLPYWMHRDRAEGQRFLGSFRITRPATDRLLQVVGANLRIVGSLTENRLQNRFSDPQETWIKIVTLALSEYAYYYSDDRFWHGFCNRLEVPYSQNAERALQTVADRGANLLGLVRARGGYRYVSTLWLQSGIPQQNLDQFAQLIQDLQVDYGWEHLAEADHSVLSEILLETCQSRHPNWATLRHFLRSSCPEDSSEIEIDPISGQLVQGIAVVAQELERQNLSPQVLLNDEEREAFLASSYLPKNFFLRSWETLTRVITLRDSASARRRLVSLRPKRPFLEVELESLDTQLVLPEQTIWKPEWRNLRGSFCYIPEVEWEDTIPTEGELNIPESIMPIESSAENWQCTLYSHNHDVLHQWNYAGISADFACLVFDALTGEHIPLKQTEPTIIGASEIYCFTPKTTSVETGMGIELCDRGVPSSLRGWRGVRLELTASEATIVLRHASGSQTIQWQTRSAEPVIQGLRLQGKQAVYLDVPVLWLPPMKSTLLNLLIEDTTARSILARTTEETSTDQWKVLSLQSWIQQPGKYDVKLWNRFYRWSCRFEIQSAYQLSETQKQALSIRYNDQVCERLPIVVETAAQFLAARIQISGLWLIEPVTLILSNGQHECLYTFQADRAGTLEISTAQFYEFFSDSATYHLSYQLAGQAPQQLLTVSTVPVETPVALITSPSSQETKVVESSVTQSTKPIPARSSAKSNWHLVTVRPGKRDVFCKQLTHVVSTKGIEQTGILNFQLCPNEIYATCVLVEVQKIGSVRTTLQEIEHFVRIEPKPLSEADVKRMMGA